MHKQKLYFFFRVDIYLWLKFLNLTHKKQLILSITYYRFKSRAQINPILNNRVEYVDYKSQATSKTVEKH